LFTFITIPMFRLFEKSGTPEWTRTTDPYHVKVVL
jgi:hypothetical protein